MAFEAGAEVELEITDTAYGGRGVGRLDGMAVFVPGCIDGERVRVRLDSVRKRYAEGDLLEVLDPSPHRQPPSCPLADRCPGCAYQHVDYAEEVRIKGRQLASLLQRLGGLADVNILPAVTAASLGYRNKIVLHAGPNGELGYYGRDKRTVFDVPQCPLAVTAINAELLSTRNDMAFMQSLQPGEAVTFRWTEKDGVRRITDSGSGGSPLTEKTPCGDLQVPEGGFFQMNPAIASRLVDEAAAQIKTQSPDVLLDLYCGVGLFALTATKAGVRHVLGIEVNGPAIRAAKTNARRLKAEGILFAEGDAAVMFVAAIEQIDAAKTMVVLDPPRDGLSPELCQALIKHRPASLLYISCSPDTLARDIKALTAKAYRVEECRLLDMFPRTAHFETMTLLRLV